MENNDPQVFEAPCVSVLFMNGRVVIRSGDRSELDVRGQA